MRAGAVLRAFVIFLCLCPALLGSDAPRSAPKPARVGVLVSHDSEQGRQVIDGFKKELDERGMSVALEIFPLGGDSSKAADPMRRAKEGGFDLLLTLGAVATQSATKAELTTPIVGGLILKPSDLGSPRAGVTGATLEFSVETELQWIRQILPAAREIGVLYNPASNQEKVDAAIQSAKALGLTIHARRVGTPKEIPAALESLSSEIDVLWGIADPVVLTPETAQPVLLFSFRNRIPFIGLSQPWAKAGALYALDRDYQDVGAQCGELAARLLGGNATETIPPIAPRKVVYWLNLETARQMKLQFSQAIVKGARDVY